MLPSSRCSSAAHHSQGRTVYAARHCVSNQYNCIQKQPNSSTHENSNCSTSTNETNGKLQPAAAYQQLPASFWDERRILYNKMRHERDRTNRRTRLKELRAVEEAQLTSMPAESRAAYEAEMTMLRIAAAKQQKATLAHALQHGLKVVIDCSYCLPDGSISNEQDHYHHQQQQQEAPSRQIEAAAAVDVMGSDTAAAAAAAITTATSSIAAGSTIYSSAASSSSSTSRASSSSLCRAPVKVQPVWQRGSDSSHEVRSLAKQIELSVSLNRRSSQPVALTVTSFTGNLALLALHSGAHAWPLNKHRQHVLEWLPAEQLVLLSPDADTPLLQLQPDKAYVIGGIVDRSVCKGLTAGFGVRHGVETVRLPVAEFAEELGLGYAGASTRPVLNVSDVVVALIEYQRTRDWVHALQQALPARKRRGLAPG